MNTFEKKYVTYHNAKEINFQEFLDISFHKTWGFCGRKKWLNIFN
jgi:hypothetical protein